MTIDFETFFNLMQHIAKFKVMKDSTNRLKTDLKKYRYFFTTIKKGVPGEGR